MQSKNTPYLEPLDHLRALAAVIVLLFEAYLRLPKLPEWSFHISIIDQGHVGVALFMVISGFILTHIAGGHELDIRRFYLNRVLRIYPLLIFIVALGYFSMPEPRPTSTGVDFLLALLPVSNLYRLSYGPYGGMLWSIAVELQFYLLFPVLHFAVRKYGVRVYLILIAFLIMVRALIFIGNGTVHQLAYFSIFGCLDIFLMGCLAHSVFQWLQKREIPRFSGVASFLIVLLLIDIAFRYRPFFHVDYYGIEADHISKSVFWIVWPTMAASAFAIFLVVYMLTVQVFPGSKVVAWIGKISFSLYVWQALIHQAILPYVASSAWFSRYSGAIALLPVTIAVATASYYVIERPFLEMRGRYLKPSAPESIREMRS